MTKLLMTCGLLVTLSACATSQPSPMAAAAPAAPAVSAAPAATSAPAAETATAVATAVNPQQPKLVCEDSQQIGSHLHSRVCLTPEQVEARKKAAQDMMLNSHNSMCASQNCAGGPPR